MVINQKIFDLVQKFLLSLILTFVFFAFIRVIEYYLFLKDFAPYLDINNYFKAARYDLHLLLIISIITLPILFTFYFTERRLLLTLFKSLYIVVVLIQLLLTHIFIYYKELIGPALFDYNFYEIQKIIGSELSLNRVFIWLMYLLIPFFAVLLNLLFRIEKQLKKITITLLLFYIFSFTSIITIEGIISPPRHRFIKEFEQLVAYNKILYLVVKTYSEQEMLNRLILLSGGEIEKTISKYQRSNPQFEYISKEYPLLHKENYENPLGKYFPVLDRKPNIVLILVEGLSSSFVGTNTHVGNLMPFLDSLIQKSLYWENFFANYSKTSGALPSIFSSLPNGSVRSEFLRIPINYPKHNSLIKILGENNYYSVFYYGGEASFDRMDRYMSYHGINDIYDATRLNPEYYKEVINSNWSSWGLDDNELFQKSFLVKDGNKNNEPYLKIYLTLSIHSPYNIVPPEYLYDHFIKTRLDKLNIENISALRKNHQDAIGSIFLCDDAFKNFFKKYEEKEEYNNTIFIITGDHGIRQFPEKSDFDRFHVPLIIYSPMLLKSENLKSVSSHVDITPSLLSLLKNNFGVITPEIVHWIGRGLRTSTAFEANTFADFGRRTNEGYPFAIYKNHYQAGHKLFLLDEKLRLLEINNQTIINSFREDLINSNLVWNYTILDNKILP